MRVGPGGTRSRPGLLHPGPCGGALRGGLRYGAGYGARRRRQPVRRGAGKRLSAVGGPHMLMAEQTHNSSLQPWPANLAWATRFLLLAGLIGAVAWSVQATRSGQAWRAGAQLLQAGHYSAAVTTLEDAINLAPPGGGPGYSSAQAHLSLSYAYLARRDFARAAAVLPDARTSPALAALIDLQRARIAVARGD